MDKRTLLTSFIDWCKREAPNHFCHEMSHTDADTFLKKTNDNKMSLKELREQFEEEFKYPKSFNVERRDNGEYRNMSTFLAWVGYFHCALTNGLVDAKLEDVHNWE